MRCHSVSQGTCKRKMTMAQEVTNFARFFAAFNKLPYNGSREEFKKQVVLQYTWNRTDSLREMTRREYNDCCDALEKLNGQKDEQKKRRSECLKLMQKIGIDTTDWIRINAFCQDPRITGKVFARLSNEELEQLSVKLRSIQRKGGLEAKEDGSQTTGGRGLCYPHGRKHPNMLTDMERKQEQALKVLRQQVLEASLNMEREEAAEFFGELADWAYAQQEAMLIDEPEMQNYDED
ncbi:hypothetical protein NXW19_20070 [Bacteroides ovatus]|nr:hypothetical protein NXW52_22640 [Bacteroides ovatus]UVP76167.1 hypothetical protein NXW19_20070 [Bacteroides ovatus]